MSEEKPSEEFARLVREFNEADSETSQSQKEEAWNLMADFSYGNAAIIIAALQAQKQ